MKKVLLISILATLAGSSAALAQPGEHGHCGGGWFGELDANHDGAVTQAEMVAHASQQFDQADANHDGKVSPEEREAAHKQRGAQHFAERDLNKDGALSPDELKHMPKEKFAALDTNHDGKLTPDELQKGFEEHHGHGRFHHEEDADHDERATHTREDMLAHVQKKFAKLDKNGDGKLTQDEMCQGHPHH